MIQRICIIMKISHCKVTSLGNEKSRAWFIFSSRYLLKYVNNLAYKWQPYFLQLNRNLKIFYIHRRYRTSAIALYPIDICALCFCVLTRVLQYCGKTINFWGVIQTYLGHVENLGMQHLIMDSIEPFLFMHCMQAVTNLPISL